MFEKGLGFTTMSGPVAIVREQLLGAVWFARLLAIEKHKLLQSLPGSFEPILIFLSILLQTTTPLRIGRF